MTQEMNIINNSIGNGNFEYVKEKRSRDLLVNAWQAISLTEMWDFVKQPIDSFVWTSDPRTEIITKKMSELGFNEHSSTSFGWTMRTMQYIAQHGEEKFKADILSIHQ